MTSLTNVTVGELSHTSEVVTLPVATEGTKAAHCTVTLPGQVSEGGVISCLVIVCTQVDMLPHLSVDFQVRDSTKDCGHAPGGITSVYVTSGAVSQLSVEVACPVLAGAVLARHPIVILAGHVRDGGELSVMTMDWTHVLELRQLSVAVQVRYKIQEGGSCVFTKLST